MSPEIQFILISSFGAMLQEFIHWYDLKGKLHSGSYKDLLKSKSYWVLTTLMIIFSGVGCYILYPEIEQKNIQLILGAAFPLLFKKLVSGIANNQDQDLGFVQEKITLKKIAKLYFR